MSCQNSFILSSITFFFFLSISFGRAITILRAFVCVSVYSVFVVPSFLRWLIIFLFMSSLFVCSFVT